MFAMQIATMVEKVHTKALNSSHLLHKNQWHRHAQNAKMHKKEMNILSLQQTLLIFIHLCFRNLAIFTLFDY